MNEDSPYVEPHRVKYLDFPLRVMTLMDPQILQQIMAREIPMRVGPDVFPRLVDITNNWTNVEPFRDCGIHAVELRIQSLKDGRQNMGCKEGDGWRIQIEGDCGEEALAQGTGRKANRAINVFSAGADVDADEVKTRVSPSDTLRTRPPTGLDMLVFKEKLILDRIYWLVLGRAPIFWIMGWRLGWEVYRFGHNIHIKGRGMSFGLHAHEMHRWMPQGLTTPAPQPVQEKLPLWEIGPDLPF
jgi:hypothetical protein